MIKYSDCTQQLLNSLRGHYLHNRRVKGIPSRLFLDFAFALLRLGRIAITCTQIKMLIFIAALLFQRTRLQYVQDICILFNLRELPDTKVDTIVITETIFRTNGRGELLKKYSQPKFESHIIIYITSTPPLNSIEPSVAFFVC